MDTMKQFNDALSYIENNLTGPINDAQMARIAGCSQYHFRRMFSFLAGMGLGEYIRRRKMTLAASLLQTKKAKVVDVAFALGYETPEAFSKAFQAMHGMSPSRAKKPGALLKAFPPVRFKLTLKGALAMEYRIVEKQAFQIVGLKKRITMQFTGINPEIQALAQKLTPEIIATLKSLCNEAPQGILNVSANFSERTAQDGTLDQYIGVATTNAAPKGFAVLPVEASTWAVFSVVGAFPDALQETWANIYAQWFPTSGYELTGLPEMLWNESPDTSKKDYRSEIWIPVRRL